MSEEKAVTIKNEMAKQPDGSRRPTVRSGPDWSSLVSNWMTVYERTLNQDYQNKIETGISDIAAMYGRSAVAAYAGMKKKDDLLVSQIWKILMEELITRKDAAGYVSQTYEKTDEKDYREISWITTNFTAQWCLNVIMCQEFIGEYYAKNRI